MLKKLSSEVSELARLRYQTYACGYFLHALILNKNPYLWTDTNLNLSAKNVNLFLREPLFQEPCHIIKNYNSHQRHQQKQTNFLGYFLLLDTKWFTYDKFNQ